MACVHLITKFSKNEYRKCYIRHIQQAFSSIYSRIKDSKTSKNEFNQRLKLVKIMTIITKIMHV